MGGFKTRWFVVTNWNMDCDFQAVIDKGQIRYLEAGKEICPKSKKEHWQMWVYFHNPRSSGKRALNEIGKMFGPIHCYVCAMRGSVEENEAYCQKDGEYTQFGEKPEQGRRGDIEVLRDLVASGTSVDTIVMDQPEAFHQYGRTLDRIEGIALRRKYRTWMTEGIWLTGPSGVGKSHHAFENFTPDTHYVKNLNEDWWDGYKGQETVILNEFRGQIAFSELLDLCDKWPKTVKWRNKEPVPFLAKTVIVTSVKHPRECYINALEDDEPWGQFERRFKIVDLSALTHTLGRSIGMEQKCSEGNIGTSEPIGTGTLASMGAYFDRDLNLDQVATASNSDASDSDEDERLFGEAERQDRINQIDMNIHF